MIDLKVRHFSTPRELAEYCADSNNNVGSIHTIINDGERWVLFYTESE